MTGNVLNSVLRCGGWTGEKSAQASLEKMGLVQRQEALATDMHGGIEKDP